MRFSRRTLAIVFGLLAYLVVAVTLCLIPLYMRGRRATGGSTDTINMTTRTTVTTSDANPSGVTSMTTAYRHSNPSAGVTTTKSTTSTTSIRTTTTVSTTHNSQILSNRTTTTTTSTSSRTGSTTTTIATVPEISSTEVTVTTTTTTTTPPTSSMTQAIFSFVSTGKMFLSTSTITTMESEKSPLVTSEAPSTEVKTTASLSETLKTTTVLEGLTSDDTTNRDPNGITADIFSKSIMTTVGIETEQGPAFTISQSTSLEPTAKTTIPKNRETVTAAFETFQRELTTTNSGDSSPKTASLVLGLHLKETTATTDAYQPLSNKTTIADDSSTVFSQEFSNETATTSTSLIIHQMGTTMPLETIGTTVTTTTITPATASFGQTTTTAPSAMIAGSTIVQATTSSAHSSIMKSMVEQTTLRWLQWRQQASR